MTKRTVPACLSLLAFGAIALHGADFWQKKKFSEWTEKEAQRMFRDSPWAKPVEIRMGGMPSGMGGGGGRGGGRRGGGGGGGGGFPDASGGAGMDSMGGGGSRAGSEMERTAQSVPSLTVTVRCQSALPVKQAVARLRYGAEAATSPEAAKSLSRQETHYIFGVADLPASALRGAKEQLKESVSLKVKGKPPVAADMVQPDVQGGRAAVYVFFPRKDNVILLEDGEFELQLKLPQVTIKRTFKLKDMVYDGKLEI